MIRKIVTICASALVAGCVSFSGARLEPGASLAEVEKAMGKPVETVKRPNGDTALYYSRLPGGRANFLATIGSDGKLRGEIEPLLTRKNVAAVKVGMDAKQVRELLGPPSKTIRRDVTVNMATVQRDCWEYPWTDVSEMRMLYLQFAADGKLMERQDGLDFENDKSKSMP
jgi:hypothetical protein